MALVLASAMMPSSANAAIVTVKSAGMIVASYENTLDLFGSWLEANSYEMAFTFDDANAARTSSPHAYDILGGTIPFTARITVGARTVTYSSTGPITMGIVNGYRPGKPYDGESSPDSVYASAATSREGLTFMQASFGLNSNYDDFVGENPDVHTPAWYATSNGMDEYPSRQAEFFYADGAGGRVSFLGQAWYMSVETAAAVPEPVSPGLLGLGAAAMLAARRRARKAQS